jgi:hypothetical protein
MSTGNRPLVAALCGLPLGALAACPSDVDTAVMAARYANLQPVPNPPADLSMTDTSRQAASS